MGGVRRGGGGERGEGVGRGVFEDLAKREGWGGRREDGEEG